MQGIFVEYGITVDDDAQAERNGRLTDDSVPYLSLYLGHDDMNGTEKISEIQQRYVP